MLRFVRPREIYVLILLTLGHCVMVHTQYSFQLALNDRCFHGHEFRSLNVNGHAECFLACVEDCFCLAFQIYDYTICQLLSTTRLVTPSSLVESPGCLYYDVIPEDNSKEYNFCQTEWSCCHHSNPCLNGGTCEPVVSSPNTKRFQCNCSPGYAGNLCQDSIKSCREYINESRVPGKYKVFDANMNLFEVFCDFDSNSTMAWTLIQSYQFQNNGNFRRRPFTQDHPVQEDTPVWDSYRLSKSKMDSIQEDSSKWRMTCRYDTDGLTYTDYVRGSNDKINILTYEGLECQEVEFIDIRGYSCTSCTATAAQNSNLFHFDSHKSKQGCSFQPMNSLSCTNAYGEDNFGLYVCNNPSHRCSSSPTSTTQTWFGNE